MSSILGVAIAAIVPSMAVGQDKIVSDFVSRMKHRLETATSILVAVDGSLKARGNSGEETRQVQYSYAYHQGQWAYRYNEPNSSSMSYSISWDGERYFWADFQASRLIIKNSVPEANNPLALPSMIFPEINFLFGDSAVVSLEKRYGIANEIDDELFSGMVPLMWKSVPVWAEEHYSIAFQPPEKEHVTWIRFQDDQIMINDVPAMTLVAFDELHRRPFIFLYLDRKTDRLLSVRHVCYDDRSWVKEVRVLHYQPGPTCVATMRIAVVRRFDDGFDSGTFSPDFLEFEAVYDDDAQMTIDPLAPESQ